MPTREEMRSLAGEIVRSYEDRIVGLEQLRETVKMDLKGFQNSRTAIAKELRTDLAKSVADRKAAVSTQLKELDATHAAMSREMRAELAKGVSNRKYEVGIMLDGFDQVLATMGKDMRADLAKGVADRKHEVSHMLRGFSAELKDIRSELAGGRDEWQILSAIMQEKRGGPMLKVKTPVEEIAEEAAEITPKTATLRNQVFEYLANHPDGTRMTGLEQEFGVARIKMARLLKGLMDENKVEKQELLYFAI